MSYIIDTKSQSQTIFLSTKKASGRNPFSFALNNYITAPTNMRMLISVEDFVISNCFPNINTNNNKLSFTSNIYGYIQITIPPVLYNINTFIIQINKQLLPYEIVGVYDQLQFKISFVSVCPFELRHSTCEALIGVGKDIKNDYIYPITSITEPAYTINLPSCIDFSGTPYIFLKCDEIIASNINSYGIINNCLCRIPVNSPYGYKIYYRPTESYKIISSLPTIQTLNFYLEDIYNNTLDIGSNDFELLLKISYIYEPIEKGDVLSGTLIHHMTTLPDEEEEEVEEDL